jgi:CheY-like chemotaxis protein
MAMNDKHILFVEDKPADMQLFTDAVSAWNEANAPKTFRIVNAMDVAQATELLANVRIDCALFDLKLPKSAEDKSPSILGGSDLARVGLQDNGIPVGVISGDPADFDPEVKKLGPIEVFNKGDTDAQEKAVAWLGDQWQMMDVLAGVRQGIRQSGASVFSKRVWPRWKYYSDIGKLEHVSLDKIVTRQYAGHIAEMLGFEGEGNSDWHPVEVYVEPALQENRPHTGDIFDLDDGRWVVLSPQCDMATKKAKLVLMAFCQQDALPNWAKHVGELTGGVSNGAAKERDKFFNRLINQDAPAAHFLPPIRDGNPMLVDFRNVKSMPLGDLDAVLNRRVASISSPFLSNLVQRYGAHVSRTGQPNIDIKFFG